MCQRRQALIVGMDGTATIVVRKEEPNMKLLVVEDEKDLNRIIVRHLKAEGYSVDSCFDGETAIDYLEGAPYDGVLLDVMLPKKNGFEVLETVRKKGVQTPVLFLTARGETEDIVTGLDLGADEYIIKPFSFKELMARIRVLVRKTSEQRDNIYCCGDLKLDTNTHTVQRAGRQIELSPKEYSILLYLVRNKNIILSRDQIEHNIWDFEYGGSSNIIDVYIRYLRKKIDNGFEQKMIQTIRGAGYMLKCDE